MRILLVEDEPDLGAAIEKSLIQESYIVDWVQEGQLAWEYLDQQWVNYTLAILDWMVPGLSGIALCQRLRAQGSALPILLLTAKDSLDDRVAGLDAGADDYLVKPFGMAELLARLRALQRRSPQLQSQYLRVGRLTLDYNGGTVNIEQGSGDPRAIALTAKEFQLLEYFMTHPRQILSGEQIKHQLWAISAESTSNVVAAQVRLLRRKLAAHDYDAAIETVHGLGYRLNESAYA